MGSREIKEQSPSTKSSLSCSLSREKSDSLSFSSHQLLRALQLGVGFYEFFLIHVGILSDLTLCKPCACSPSYHEFMCVAALSCPADTVFYKLYFFRFLTFFLFPLPQWSLSALSPSLLSLCVYVCVIWISCLGLSTLQYSACWPIVSLDCHILQKEVC